MNYRPVAWNVLLDQIHTKEELESAVGWRQYPSRVLMVTRPDDLLVLPDPTGFDYIKDYYWRIGIKCGTVVPLAPTGSQFVTIPLTVDSEASRLMVNKKTFIQAFPEFSPRTWFTNSEYVPTHVIVKPDAGTSGVGISFPDSRQQLAEALVEGFHAQEILDTEEVPSIQFFIDHRKVHVFGVTVNVVDGPHHIGNKSASKALHRSLAKRFLPVLYDLRGKGFRGLGGFDVMRRPGTDLYLVVDPNGRFTGASAPCLFARRVGGAVVSWHHQAVSCGSLEALTAGIEASGLGFTMENKNGIFVSMWGTTGYQKSSVMCVSNNHEVDATRLFNMGIEKGLYGLYQSH